MSLSEHHRTTSQIGATNLSLQVELSAMHNTRDARPHYLNAYIRA